MKVAGWSTHSHLSKPPSLNGHVGTIAFINFYISYDQRQLREEFILACTSRGLESIMAGKAWQREQEAEGSHLSHIYETEIACLSPVRYFL